MKPCIDKIVSNCQLDRLACRPRMHECMHKASRKHSIILFGWDENQGWSLRELSFASISIGQEAGYTKIAAFECHLAQDVRSRGGAWKQHENRENCFVHLRPCLEALLLLLLLFFFRLRIHPHTAPSSSDKQTPYRIEMRNVFDVEWCGRGNKKKKKRCLVSAHWLQIHPIYCNDSHPY